MRWIIHDQIKIIQRKTSANIGFSIIMILLIFSWFVSAGFASGVGHILYNNRSNCVDSSKKTQRIETEHLDSHTVLFYILKKAELVFCTTLLFNCVNKHRNELILVFVFGCSQENACILQCKHQTDHSKLLQQHPVLLFCNRAQCGNSKSGKTIVNRYALLWLHSFRFTQIAHFKPTTKKKKEEDRCRLVKHNNEKLKNKNK